MGKGKELLPLPLSIEVTKALKGLGKKKTDSSLSFGQAHCTNCLATSYSS